LSERAFDPFLAFGVLSRHDVRYVLIGGFAGKLHGSPALTADIDICYARDDANLERLVALRARPEARRGGEAGMRPCRSRGSPYH
jgi:hypothetical protein